MKMINLTLVIIVLTLSLFGIVGAIKEKDYIYIILGIINLILISVFIII